MCFYVADPSKNLFSVKILHYLQILVLREILQLLNADCVPKLSLGACQHFNIQKIQNYYYYCFSKLELMLPWITYP